MKPIKQMNERLREKRCENKRQYSLYTIALRASNRMNIINAKTIKLTKETRNRPYKCEYCNEYHIGKWSVEKI